MKKHLFLIVALLCTVVQGAGAQTAAVKTKMSSWLQSKYQQEQLAVKKNGGPKRVQGRKVRTYVLTLVKVAGDLQYPTPAESVSVAGDWQSSTPLETIREQGGVVLQDFDGSICAAFLPVDKLGELAQNPGILRIEANAPLQLMNDTSAVLVNADKAWTLSPSTQQLSNAQCSTFNVQRSMFNVQCSTFNVQRSTSPSFTGQGVVAAVMDIGFDFTHPAFRHDDGTSRVRWFWEPMAPDANADELGMVYSTPAEVLAALHCVNADNDNHGTHVMGTMAGRGLDGRYVGMAPEADIMGAHVPLGEVPDEYVERVVEYIRSHLADYPLLEEFIEVEPSDAIVLVELYRIFKAADAIGEPCVVNWSFGSPTSFFNDTTLFEEVFNNLVGPGHIVVSSAGNGGHYLNYLIKDAGEPMEQDVYYSATINQFLLTMRTEPDAPPFTYGLIFNCLEDTIFVNTDDIAAISAQGDTLVVEYPELSVHFMASPGGYDKTVYESWIVVTDSFANAIKQNNLLSLRGKVLVDAPVQMEMLGGVSNKTTAAFSTENLANARGCHLYTIGTPGNLERIITVGAMHHRTTFTSILGYQNTDATLGSVEGHLASFSSCGPTLDGRHKPDVVAPGHNVISCLNSFYRYNHDDKATYDAVAPKTVYTSKLYGQTYGVWGMSGTSMSSPVAAGVIALWLQAKPDLTPEDILGVIERTSRQPEPDFSGTDKNPYYGWGEIDAYAGLLDILGIPSAISSLSRHQPAGVTFRLNGRTLVIDGAAAGTPLTVYDLSGRPVFQTVITGAAVSVGGDLQSVGGDLQSPTAVRLPALAAGVYAIQLGQSGSTLIRTLNIEH